MAISLNRGNPILTPKYHRPYYRDAQSGTPSFGKLPFLFSATYDTAEIKIPARLPGNLRGDASSEDSAEG